MATVQQEISTARKSSYLTIALLMGAAALLVLLMMHRLTRSLHALVRASESIIQGNYAVEVPASSCREFEQLTHSFQQMQFTLHEREEQLRDLNQHLEQQVNERTQDLATSQAELAREQRLSKSILEHVGDGVVAVDATGRFILWNHSAEAILGRVPTELPSNQWSSYFGLYRSSGNGQVPAEELPLMRALKGETVRNQELYVRHSDTTPGRWISVFARPLINVSARVEGAVAVLVDIDESRRLREQRATQAGELARIGRLTLLGQIVDTMAHRLSQPLAAIANYTGAATQMRNNNTLDEQHLDQFLAHITRLAERGGDILSAIRSLTLRGHRPLGKIDVNGLVLSALQLLGERMEREHIQSETNLATDLPPVYGQEMELQQAIIHLIINAMEALTTRDDQDRRLELKTSYSAERSRVHIEVSDNGPGIETGLYDRIFEPWFTTKPDALGLGLTVTRSISEKHGGSVRIESQRIGITRFVVELPLFDESNA